MANKNSGRKKQPAKNKKVILTKETAAAAARQMLLISDLKQRTTGQQESDPCKICSIQSECSITALFPLGKIKICPFLNGVYTSLQQTPAVEHFSDAVPKMAIPEIAGVWRRTLISFNTVHTN